MADDIILIGVDTGGTFTDFLYKDGDSWGEYKLLSTPHNPAEAVLKGIKHIAGTKKFTMCHGSTVATNAILEKKGAKTALVTNKGFEDILEIGRQNRPELYDLFVKRSRPLVDSSLRFGVGGRVDCSGVELEGLDKTAVSELRDILTNEGVESIAVSLLFSFLDSTHENEIREILSELNIPISLSYETLAEFREYERTSTTVINAYVSPKMTKYITFLTDNIGDNILRIMQSNGGSISASTAMRESVRTILSGPAGGAVGAYEIGKTSGFDKLITFDMGGTSTDVALIDSGLPLTVESAIDGFPVKVPMIDIHTVGAGGGSIASVDAGGSLKVGPESAGADPGPICYGKGTDITVTDANLYLGRLLPEMFLGGHMDLDTEHLEKHFNNIANELGVTTLELAEGVIDVANTEMERALKVISIEKGYDPREFALFSFGGAGGLHACYLAKSLNMSTVFIPKNPGILSAAGMLMADVIKDYSKTIMVKLDVAYEGFVEDGFGDLVKKAKQELVQEGVPENNIVLEYYLDMRYVGQSYEIIVPFENYVDKFHEMHEKSYGYCNRDKQIEIVNIRLRGKGLPEKPELKKYANAGVVPDSLAFVGEKSVVFDGVEHTTHIIDRAQLASGNSFDGPAVVTEYSSTIVIPPFASVKVDEYLNLIINIDNGVKK
jgi:N-methylhydantoinase A